MNCNREEARMKRKLMLLLGSMAAFIVIVTIMISLIYPKAARLNKEDKEPIHVVTSFYPIYLIGMNIADEMDGVEVSSLTDMNTGCLHDYQLTTQDMKAISNADVLVINGGGMEGFLEDIKTNYPNLTIINASEGITMLKYEAATGGSSVVADNISKSEEHVVGKYNPHVWLNPELYIQQIENVRDGLTEYINKSKTNTSVYREELNAEIDHNSSVYIDAVQTIEDEIDTSLKQLTLPVNGTGKRPQAVIFHDAFAYLADKVGLQVAFTVPLDSDTALSAGDIAVIIDEVKKEDIKLLFTEQQYSDSIAKQIEAETNANVYIIDSVVTGDGAKDSYLTKMRNNLMVIKKALQ